MTPASLNGLRVTGGRLYLPAFGVPWAEIAVDQEASLSGAADLSFADLKVAGTIMSGGAGPKGRASFRIAAGKGSWGRTIPADGYHTDSGVKASTVLADAATACGETIDAATLPTTRLGADWARDEGPAARVLQQIVPAGWYVGEDGVTRIGKRPATTLKVPSQVSAVDRARAKVELAADAIATLVPGVTVEGIEAVDVLHELTGTTLRTTIWGAGIATTDRFLAALKRILEQLDPGRKFRGTYEYRVGFQVFDRFTLQPVRVSTGMPDLQLVSARYGVPGMKADLAMGARVLVTFVDADPARPVIVAFEEPGGDGFLPSSLTIDADDDVTIGRSEHVLDVLTAATGRFVRYGDKVVTFPGGVATTGVLLPSIAPVPGDLSRARSG
jgi:hypothetical protein